MIFKLANLSDKETLWDNIKNVTDFNKKAATDAKKVFIQMNQLPTKLAHDKQSLYSAFKDALLA